MVKITPDHKMAGHHAHNHCNGRGVGVFARISDKLGAGRGLRQGCESTTGYQSFLFFSASFPALLSSWRDSMHCLDAISSTHTLSRVVTPYDSLALLS